jgi:hypothetical protein
LSDGQVCTPNQGVPCRNACNRFLLDCDGDTFFSETSANRCGTTPPRADNCPNGGYRAAVPNRPVDCCDGDSAVYPDQRFFFDTPNACGDFNYDCRNGEEPTPVQECGDFGLDNCPPSVTSEAGVACGALVGTTLCGLSILGGMTGFCEPEEPGCQCAGLRFVPDTQACR